MCPPVHLSALTRLVTKAEDGLLGAGEPWVRARRPAGEGGTENEPSVGITVEDSVMLEGDGEAVGGWAGQSGRRDEVGEGAWRAAHG